MSEHAAAAGASAAVDRLIAILARLRHPEHGGPWELAQTHATLAPYAIEEAYETADAVERGDLEELKDELGDLLLQVVFQAQIAEETGAFAFKDVADAISDKILRRNPHVFSEAGPRDVEAQLALWEAIKADERRAKAPGRSGALDDVPASLPALLRAVKLTGRAARVGFDWPDTGSVLAKLDEEMAELKAEIDAGDLAKARAELGDLLFVCANLARKLDVDPEDALRATNAKFIRRFSFIEQALTADGRRPEQATLDEMDALWDAAKRAER